MGTGRVGRVAAGLLSPSQLPVLTMAAQSLKDQGKGAWPAVPGEAPVGGWRGEHRPMGRAPPPTSHPDCRKPVENTAHEACGGATSRSEAAPPPPSSVTGRRGAGGGRKGAGVPCSPHPAGCARGLAGTASLSPSVRVPFSLSLCLSVTRPPAPSVAQSRACQFWGPAGSGGPSP